MTFKEELDEQRRRLEKEQKQYFANQRKPDGGRDEFYGSVILRPGIALLRDRKFYGGGEVPGADEPVYRSNPEIVRFAQQKFYGGGEVTKNSAPQAPSGGTDLPSDSDAQGENTPHKCEVREYIFRFRGRRLEIPALILNLQSTLNLSCTCCSGMMSTTRSSATWSKGTARSARDWAHAEPTCGSMQRSSGQHCHS